MKNFKNKLTSIALILLLTVSIPLLVLPTAEAHTAPWTLISYAYISVAPDPVGVGQTVAIVMWVDTPQPGTLVGNNIRRHNYSLTITKPDGTTDNQHWDTILDATGFQYYRYTPLETGNYTFDFSYPGEIYKYNQANTPGLDAASALYENDTLTASSATTEITAQQESIPMPLDSYPLPTEYWTRPIEGENTYWYTQASNWLGTPYILGAASSFGIPGAIQPNGIAPNSDHVMWAKDIQYGGLVGGNGFAVPGELYYQGGSYNVRYNNPIIMQGTIFYQEPNGEPGTGGDYVAVDLRTGQELWRINATATGISLVPSFGYLYSLEDENQHGILPNGMLIAAATVSGQGTVWRGYDPRTGHLTNMNVTNVPGGTAVAGPWGEYLKYILTNYGNTTNPKYNLMQWNSSRVFGNQGGTVVGTWYTGTSNASLPTAYDWNVTLNLPPGTWTIGTTAPGISNFPLIDLGNMLLLIQGTFGGHVGDYSATVTTNPANITAISLKPDTLGNVLWTKTYPQAPANTTRYLSTWDPANGVFIFDDKETMVHYGYSLTDGSYLWGPTTLEPGDSSPWNYMALGQSIALNGTLYWTGSYSGLLYAFDDTNGKLLWVFGNGDEPYNSTSSGFTTPYGRYPLFISTIADGKIYLTGTEHSPNSPIYKGEKFYCINATDGKELWAILSDGNQMYGGQAPVADGYITVLNTYDCRIYGIGKGPSALTVAGPELASPLGAPVLLKGTVTDIAAGTMQPEQAARFPNGVAAVSDESMTQWMEYIYMQKPKPTDVTGVPVSIDVIDANGNYRNIGKTTTDSSGTFSYVWTPDIDGKYTVIASFAGSESYWPSSAENSFVVTPLAPTSSPYPVVNLPPTDMYIAAAAAAIIVAIIIGFAITILVLRKRP